MAKGSAMGLWKGKKGSSVFYQIKNSNSLQKQGVRERNYEPANPQTANQASQRMRMYPAQAVYGVIKDVIERSWQGVKYGQMSRQEYLKHALRQKLFPSVTKGASVVVPGPYQISKGTLQEVEATVSPGRFIFPLFVGGQINFDSDLSQLSQELLAKNAFLSEGDQLSFVLCHSNINGDGFYWQVISFYIDSQADNVSVGDILGARLNRDEITLNGEGISFVSGDHIFMAAACVISREGDTPLRSTAYLACDYNAGDMQAYYSAEALNSAKRSYMKQESALSLDWPADPSDSGSGDGTIAYTATSINTTMGTVTGGGNYLPGELVALTATANTNYQFIGWYATQADAEAGENRLSGAAIITFSAGDSTAFGGTKQFWAKFMLEE